MQSSSRNIPRPGKPVGPAIPTKTLSPWSGPRSAPRTASGIDTTTNTSSVKSASSTFSPSGKRGAGDGAGVGAGNKKPSPTLGSGGGSHRSAGQLFKTNPANGTLSLTLPFQVTPGRAGFTPNLNLSYDSGFGNGPFGLGWALPADNVTCKTSKRIPRYDDSDVFILSGTEDLVPITNSTIRVNDFTVCSYRPRVQRDVVRIERWTRNLDGGDIFWRTINGENRTTIFGRTDASRIFAVASDGKKKVFSWLISETFDAYGNAIRYQYKSENSDGFEDVSERPIFEMHRTVESRACMKYLKRIQYGNKKPNRDLASWEPLPVDSLDFMFDVVLDYGEHDALTPTTDEVAKWPLRKDPFSTYNAGFEIRTYRLVRRILLFHHLPEKLKRNDYLVKSLNLIYSESETRSCLESARFCGHIIGEDGCYQTQSVAPHDFLYSKAPSLKKIPLEKIDASMLQSLPGSSKFKTDWVDLNGEGSAGLLTQRDGAWVYQRNQLAAKDKKIDAFGPAGEIQSHPNQAGRRGSYFEDLNRTGRLDVVYLDENGRLEAYQERQPEGWAEFKTFKSSLTFSLSDPRIKRVDLTGDGLQDLLYYRDSSVLLWRQSLGSNGFGEERTVLFPNPIPWMTEGDENARIYTLDMSGSGLTDIVQVANGSIIYWPNLGYGNFGSKVTMQNCPIFDSDDQFKHSRVRFIDADGSGTTDVVYLMPGGGAKVYFNHCGNSWSSGKTISNFPQLDNLSSVVAMDLLGSGTACLCWSSPITTDSSPHSLYYIDLMRGIKPHLLTTYSNNSGFSMSVHYRPSTWFYLNDLLHGQKWHTSLPYPVHCVEKIIQTDAISLTATTTCFAYHDGYHDAIDKEFRGFGMVEQWDAEDFDISNTTPFFRPPAHIKTWYHTGAIEIATTPSLAATPPQLRNTKFPNNVGPEERSEICRAMKGLELRKEIFSDDGSQKADLPYEVVESRYTILRLQAPASSAGVPGIYEVHPREVLVSHYERNLQNPRQEHQLTLEMNVYGQVTKSARIIYGNEASSLPTPEDRTKQSRSIFEYVETDYGKILDEKKAKENSFRKPLTSAERKYQILNYDTTELVDADTLINGNCYLLESIPEGMLPSESTEIPGDAAVLKTLVAEKRIRYLDNSLSTKLPIGSTETFSVIDQTFDLCFTPDILRKSFGNASELAGRSIKAVMETGGYVQLDSDSKWWSPTVRALYDDNWNSQLKSARSSFYTPTVSIDQFNNKSHTTYDQIFMLPELEIDAMSNKTSYENDYLHFLPWQVTDINGNRSESKFDAFGQLIGSISLGKPDELLGDSFDTFKNILSTGDIEDFIKDPISQAKKFLGNAGSRSIYSRERVNLKTLGKTDTDELLPTFEATLSRDKHFRNGEAKILIQITYLDAHGDAMQEVVLVSDAAEDLCWRISGWELRDNKGKAAKLFQPSFSPSHLFQSQANIQSPATIIFSDPLGRIIGNLYANLTWDKIEFSPWHQISYDAGDTIHLDIATDETIGSSYRALSLQEKPSSTWYSLRMILDKDSEFDKWDADAARKSSLYDNSPTITHFDPLIRPILVIMDTGSQSRCHRVNYDLHGNKTSDIDARGRIVEKACFDLLNNLIYKSGMDYGDRWVVLDCLGKEIFKWNTRGIYKRLEYDALRRHIQTWTWRKGKTPEQLTMKVHYGEDIDPQGAARQNLRGQVAYVYDQSGLLLNDGFDFKGNCIRSIKKFAKDYKSTIDWNNDVKQALLQDEQYTNSTIFDALSRDVGSINTKGQSTRRVYNLNNAIEKVLWRSSNTSPWQPFIKNISYSEDGEPILVNYGNGSHASYTYDEKTRNLVKMRVWTDSGTLLEDKRLTYDCVGQVTHISDTVKGTQYYDQCSVDGSNDYTYDGLGQLIQAEGREQYDARNGGKSFRPFQSLSSFGQNVLPVNGISMCRFAETYEYDAAGNILLLKHEAIGGSKVSGWTRRYYYEQQSFLESGKLNNQLSRTAIGRRTDNYSYQEEEGSTPTPLTNMEVQEKAKVYEEDGEPESYSYTGNSAGRQGCMTKMPGYSSLTWDCEDMLKSSSSQISNDSSIPETTWYIYDSNGNRVRKVTERAAQDKNIGTVKLKEMVYLPDVDILIKYDGSGHKIDDGMASSQVIGTARVAIIDEHNVIRYQVHQGLELDDMGNIVSYEEYSPFGATTFMARGKHITAPRKYRFASYERDEETGLYYCGQRYYASWLGRWISSDPIGTGDGLNLYRYVSNDPINLDDPTGTCERKIYKVTGNPKATATNAIPKNYTSELKTVLAAKVEKDKEVLHARRSSMYSYTKPDRNSPDRIDSKHGEEKQKMQVGRSSMYTFMRKGSVGGGDLQSSNFPPIGPKSEVKAGAVKKTTAQDSKLPSLYPNQPNFGQIMENKAAGAKNKKAAEPSEKKASVENTQMSLQSLLKGLEGSGNNKSANTPFTFTKSDLSGSNSQLSYSGTAGMNTSELRNTASLNASNYKHELSEMQRNDPPKDFYEGLASGKYKLPQ